jgi:protein-disulfide isomerase
MLRPVKPSHWMILLRVASLIALATSVALLADYTSQSPAFCTSADTGCGAVRQSGWGYPLGIPMPALGIAGFALLFSLSMFESPARRRALPIVAGAGGLAALGLLVLQAVTLKTFCALCVIVDLAGVVAAVAALAWSRSPLAAGGPAAKKRKRSSRAPALADPLDSWAWWVLAGIAVAAPLIWPRVRPQPPIAPEIAALYVPGKINVVEFADFECPHCRRLHPELKKLVAEFSPGVNFVRMNLPLKSHVHALGAAKAVVCAEKQGKGDELADALFASEDLTLSAIRRIAVGLGIDTSELDRCIDHPDTAARLHREEQILRAAGFEGLPTTYIGAQRIVGARAPEVFREAFEKAKRGEGNEGIPAWLFIALLGLLAGGTVYLGRKRA